MNKKNLLFEVSRMEQKIGVQNRASLTHLWNVLWKKSFLYFRSSETNYIADDVALRTSTKHVLENKSGSYIYAKDKLNDAEKLFYRNKTLLNIGIAHQNF